MTGRLRGWLPLAILIALGVILALVGGSGRDTGRPLDPASTGELGTRALVLLLEEMGADVSLSSRPPTHRAGTALLLADNLDGDGVAELLAWVRAGGTLVVADPFSEVAPVIARERGGLFDDTDADSLLERDCELPVLGQVGRIEVPVATGYDVPRDAVGCFATAAGSFLVARAEGAGTIVALGGPGLWVNANLDHEDNAVLAVSLLAPTPGGRVRFMEPPGPGEGRRSLTDLIRPSVRSALWQLVVAFGIYALWRSRRLGRPVVEHQPVEVPGAELVVAVGNMLHKAGRRDQAAAMVRRDVLRVLQGRLGLGPDAPRDVVLDAVERRSSLSRERLDAVLFSSSPVSDAELVALAATIESLKTEVLHA